MIRTLLVDDSPAFRLALKGVLAEDPAFDVVGVAESGREALQRARALRPELVVMDLVMPGMSGLQTIPELMRDAPCPVVILSSAVDEQGQETVFELLRAGAVDVLAKPRELARPEVREKLRGALKAMASVRVVRQRRSPTPPPLTSSSGRQLVLVGASTGGPPALAQLLAGLPNSFPLPIVVAQHLASGFAAGLCHWLSRAGPLPVALATASPLRLRPGTIYLAPDDHHLELQGPQTLAAVPGARGPSSGVMPSVARLYESALPFASEVVGVLLTGMGEDGAQALLKLRSAGAHTLVQDERSSLVYGMPRVAFELGAASEQMAISEMAARLVALSREELEEA